jgi:hypothetical protein
MFKWFFIIFVTFILVWLFGRPYLPEDFKNSSFGQNTQDVLFPLTKRIDKLLGVELKYQSSIIKLDSNQFNTIINSINSANKPAVIYFFSPKDFSTRFLLRKINQLAIDQKNSNIVFFIAAFDDTIEDFSFLINDYQTLGFRPIILDTASIKVAEYAFIKNNIKLSGVPAIVYKSEERIYESIVPDLGAKDRIQYLISNE